jgi:hypothetical protein
MNLFCPNAYEKKVRQMLGIPEREKAAVRE